MLSHCYKEISIIIAYVIPRLNHNKQDATKKAQSLLLLHPMLLQKLNFSIGTTGKREVLSAHSIQRYSPSPFHKTSKSKSAPNCPSLRNSKWTAVIDDLMEKRRGLHLAVGNSTSRFKCGTQIKFGGKKTWLYPWFCQRYRLHCLMGKREKKWNPHPFPSYLMGF